MLRLLLGTGVLVFAVLAAQQYHVSYKIMSNLYLPYTYTPVETYGFDQDAAEQMAFDSFAKILYTVGHTNIHVIDLSDVTSPRILYNVSYNEVDITDVEICGDHVFVSFDNQTRREDGFVKVFQKFNPTTNTLEVVHSIIVGTFPDMVAPTSDCATVLVAIEAKPYQVGQTLVDNSGGIGLIKFANGPGGTYSYKVVGFESFNSRYDELKQSGVRHINPNSTFAGDVEPEYIVFNKDESKAYVTLQENNAIAVFDMTTENVTDIFGLGFKNWSSYTLDPSDRDNGINMKKWPVFGMYQPDSIKLLTYNGVDYVITADEGDSKDYGIFSEEARVKDLDLSPTFGNADDINKLQQDSALGRLKVTTMNGLNEDTNTYDSLCAFGGRGFSIRRADDMELVYDSGDEISRKTALLTPHIFNTGKGTEDTVSESFDTRSDNEGPETESLAIGHFGNISLLMVGNERPGSIAIYKVDNRQPTISPTFETIITQIPEETTGTWAELYDMRAISILDPEDMHFVSDDDSPNGKNLLLVCGSVSGTITVIQIDVVESESQVSGAGEVHWNQGLLFVTTTCLLVTFIMKKMFLHDLVLYYKH